MATTLRQDILALVEEMDRDVDAVIVEGSNDAEAIRRAGFSGEIYTCAEGTDGIVALATRVKREHDAIAILTDYDPEGREFASALQEVIPESRLRKIWRKKLGKVLTGKGRRDIESINNILDRAD